MPQWKVAMRPLIEEMFSVIIHNHLILDQLEVLRHKKVMKLNKLKKRKLIKKRRKRVRIRRKKRKMEIRKKRRRRTRKKRKKMRKRKVMVKKRNPMLLKKRKMLQLQPKGKRKLRLNLRRKLLYNWANGDLMVHKLFTKPTNRTSVKLALRKAFKYSPLLIPVCFHSHGEDSRRHTLLTAT